MIYPFKCPKCTLYKEIVAMVKDMPKEGSVICPDCEIPMQRIFSANEFKVSANKNYFDHALGREITNDAQKREAMKEIEGKTGMKLEEVGNESTHHIQPKRHDWDKVVDDLAKDGVFENVDSADRSVFDE